MLVANKVTDAGVVIDHIYNWFGVFGGLVVALTLSFSAGEQHLMRLIRHLTRGDLYPGMDGIDLHHRMNFVVFLFFVLVNQIPVPLAPLCGAEVVVGVLQSRHY